MYRHHRITVVMPVHNEQTQVRLAIARVPSFVDHIVAVDDGSTDDTLKLLKQNPDRRLIVIEHSRNLGVGAATKTGYRRALLTGADLIAVMDGDGQMDGNDLHRLLDRALGGTDYVKGNRFLDTKSITTMPRMRFIGNLVFSYLTRIAASFAESLDAHCGYTVINRQALERLQLDRLYDRYGFPTEMFFAANRAGLSITSVSVATIYGDEVSGINPLTTVPTVFFLIARNCLRRQRSIRRSRENAFKSVSVECAEYHLEA